jgi:hypothetical protein
MQLMSIEQRSIQYDWFAEQLCTSLSMGGLDRRMTSIDLMKSRGI